MAQPPGAQRETLHHYHQLTLEIDHLKQHSVGQAPLSADLMGLGGPKQEHRAGHVISKADRSVHKLGIRHHQMRLREHFMDVRLHQVRHCETLPLSNSVTHNMSLGRFLSLS